MALEIAAEELRSGGLRSPSVQKSLEQQEEGTIYAQIIHFINLIINFRVPLSAATVILNPPPPPTPISSVTTPDGGQLMPPGGGGPHSSSNHHGNHQALQGSVASPLSNGWPAAANGSNGSGNNAHVPRRRDFTR